MEIICNTDTVSADANGHKYYFVPAGLV